MVSTVTISTVTTVTTVTTTVVGLFATVGIIAMIVLIGFLATKELAISSKGSRRRLFAGFLDVGIVPLMVVFAVIAVMRVLGVLS